jgi:hypothetical protein
MLGLDALSREELVALVRDQAARLGDRDADLDWLRQ